MDVVHLNQKQLAARWNISEASLERWRSEGIGPKFLKICGRYPSIGADRAPLAGADHRGPTDANFSITLDLTIALPL